MKRKMFSIFLAVAMVFTLATTALAVDQPEIPANGGTIWIDDVRVEANQPATFTYEVNVADSFNRLNSVGSILDIPASTTGISVGTPMVVAPGVNAKEFCSTAAKTTGKGLAGLGMGTARKASMDFTVPNVTATTAIGCTLDPETFYVYAASDPDTLVPDDKVELAIGSIIVQYPVTVTVGEGGTVSTKTTEYADSGKNTYDSEGTAANVATDDVIWVDSGADQQNQATFSFTPDTNYVLKDILVNGVTIGAGNVLTANAAGSYTTSAISADTQIAFQFEKNVSFVATTVKTYTDGVAATSTTGGVVSYGGSDLNAEDQVEVTYTGNQIFNIKPNEGYQIKKVEVDGVENTSLAGKIDERTVAININNLTVDHSIVVEYEKRVFNITTTVEPTGDGTITGPASVEYGENAEYTFSPKDSTVEVKEVWVDGVKQTNPDVTGYTFTDVTENHTLKVVFGAAISEIIVDPDAGLTMDGDKAVVVLRGKWANETTFTDMLSSIKINDGKTPVDSSTVTLSLGSATAFNFPGTVVPVELDTATFGKVNVLQSGIVEVTVTAKADTSKSVTFVFIVPGDSNRDGRVKLNDATRCGDLYLGDLELTEKYDMEMNDLNKDGKIRLVDATIIGDIYLGDREI